MMDALRDKLALEEFFQIKVKEAVEIQKVDISEEVEFYLVNILTHFAKSENLYQIDDDGKVEDRALALKLYDSVFACTPNERFFHLKSLGDTALYHAGIFYEGLYNKMVDVGYYINMGGSAYQTLSHLSTGNNQTLAEMFEELSKHFSNLVEVLNICCEKEEIRSHKDLLKLLDRYLKTGSQKAKEILEEEGILADALIGNQSIQ